MSSRLIHALATTEQLAELFADTSVLKAMLEFEAALARAESKANLIPEAAAEAIVAAAVPENFDLAALARETLRAGTAAIPVANMLRAAVRSRDPRAAHYVHFGATSQDVADTAIVLLLKRAQPLLEADAMRLERALRSLAEAHSATVMLGRTLLQPAPAVTFGLKAAGWLAAIHRASTHCWSAFRGALQLQFGGASGTLAALEEKGLRVAGLLAQELGLQLPEAPWHSARDRLATLAAACGVLTGCLGKIARDISLLMQHEVAEAAEAAGPGRGGSSTMPNKRNPIGCAITLAAAQRTPGLVASFLSSMVQEHERAVGGWQAEWPIISGIIQATGVALQSMAEVAEGLEVDSSKMTANIQATQGTLLAEHAMMLLTPALGRERAQQLAKDAAFRSLSEQRNFAEVLSEMPEAAGVLNSAMLEQIKNPAGYLGSAEALRRRLLASTSSAEHQDHHPTEKE